MKLFTVSIENNSIIIVEGISYITNIILKSPFNLKSLRNGKQNFLSSGTSCGCSHVLTGQHFRYLLGFRAEYLMRNKGSSYLKPQLVI